MAGVALVPWKLFANPQGYFSNWLVGLSTFTGSALGVMLVDYFWVHRQRLNIRDLFAEPGTLSMYWYSQGFNGRALVACGLGILPVMPGFIIHMMGLRDLHGFVHFVRVVYDYAWFLALALTSLLYAILSRSRRSTRTCASSASTCKHLSQDEEENGALDRDDIHLIADHPPEDDRNDSTLESPEGSGNPKLYGAAS